MNTNTNQIISTTSNTAPLNNEAFLAKFKATTGWDYSDAVAMAVECRTEDRLFGNRFAPKRNLRARTVRVQETAEQKFERETGWTMSDAIDMAVEVRRENRIFGRLN